MLIVKKFRKRFPNINSILVVIAIVLIWRGVWNLMDEYFFPNDPIYSYIIGILIGIMFLLIDDLRLTELHHDEPIPEIVDRIDSKER